VSDLASLERQLRKGDKALVGNTSYRRFLKTAAKATSPSIAPRRMKMPRFDGLFVLRTNTDLSPPSLSDATRRAVATVTTPVAPTLRSLHRRACPCGSTARPCFRLH
jgi:hypothetical protein